MNLEQQPNFPILAPSLIAADWMKMGEEIQSCLDLGLGWLHCDVMDGHFVPNLTMGPDYIKSIKQQFPQAICDCHLMVSTPNHWVPKFIKAGADVITVHAENTRHTDIVRWHDRCKEAGVMFGLSLRPTTPVDVITPWLSYLQLVVVMSVYPGFFGQAYIEGSEKRIEQIRQAAGSHKLWISVDGGINTETAKVTRQAGADIFVSGGAFFKPKDRKKTLQEFQKAFT